MSLQLSVKTFNKRSQQTDLAVSADSDTYISLVDIVFQNRGVGKNYADVYIGKEVQQQWPHR